MSRFDLRCGGDGLCSNARDFSALPYPGERVPGSWLVTSSGHVHRVEGTEQGWVDIAAGEPLDLTDRRHVLGYGSNLNPAKLREKIGGTVVVLAATVYDWAAVWCDARRSAGDVVATIAPVSGAVEQHGVLVVTDAQLAQMDSWEGHPRYYRRETFAGRCDLADGSAPSVEVYVGTPERRPVLFHEGRMLRCGSSGVPHEVVDQLVPGRAAW